jgi:DNA-binding NarL/FixJ family response regulator
VKGSRGVLIVTADRLLGESAAALIDAREGWHVVGTSTDGISAMTAVARLAPQAVLLSGELQRLPVAAFVTQVRKRWPDVTVVALGGPSTPGAIQLDRNAPTEAIMLALASGPGVGAAEGTAPDGVALLRRLTQRERTVLMKLAAGIDPDEIAHALGVRENTVRTHMQNLYAKLGRHNRLEVVRFALEQGLVSEEPRPS